MAQVLHGNASGNQLNAHANKTQIYGLQGNDTLTSDGKSDVLLMGGSGDDSLVMSGGNGTLSGGKGADTFELTYSANKKLSAVIEDLVPSEDKIVVNFDGNTAPQISSSVNGNDVVLRDGERLNVTVKGVRDNDYFDGDAHDYAWNVLELTNAERENQGLFALTMSDGLTNAALLRAREITALGVLGLLTDHTRPDGSHYDTVFDEVGKTYLHHGENLDGGAADPKEVVEQWIGSASHYANIINPDFKKLGVGYNYDDPDPTNHRYYWTQLFGDSLTAQETVDVSSASPEVNAVTKLIKLTDNPDTYSNCEYSATILAKSGNDSISNAKPNVSISGGAGNDTIRNDGDDVTIDGSAGDDRIGLGSDAKNNVIRYLEGDGNDTIAGFNEMSMLSILSGEYTPATVGNDVVIAVGDDSITLVEAGCMSSVKVIGRRSNLFLGTEGHYHENSTFNYINVTITAQGGNDYITNETVSGATILALGGDDTIRNNAELNLIDGGAGNDTIYNYGNSVTIDGGAGDDSIYNNESNNVTLDAGEGNDTIHNSGNGTTIDAGAGDDSILTGYASLYSLGSVVQFVTVNGGSGNDTILNTAADATISGGAGNDSIRNVCDRVSIDTGDGNDTVTNYQTNNVTIDGGTGNDSIENYGSDVSMLGGAGDDSVEAGGSLVTIDTGSGNDNISIVRDSANVSAYGGEGDDYISDFRKFFERGSTVTMNGGAGDDSIISIYTPNAAIIGGTGNDLISLSSDTGANLIAYSAGDGSDTVRNFNADDTLRIGDSTGSYSTQQSGADVIVRVGAGFIALVNAASLEAVNIEGKLRLSDEEGDSSGFENVDILNNSVDGAAIVIHKDQNVFVNNSGANVDIYIGSEQSNDCIWNSGANCTINTTYGNDTIFNSSSNNTLEGGTGDDLISLSGGAQNILIRYTAADSEGSIAGDGNDSIVGFTASDTLSILGAGSSETVGSDIIVTLGDDSITLAGAASLTNPNIVFTPRRGGTVVTLTEGDDYYYNQAEYATILALGGDDTVDNWSYNTIIDAGTGNDSIEYWRSSATILGGDGNDYIYGNSHADGSSLDGGNGNDTLFNSDNNSTLWGGAGNDYIQNSGSYVTIKGNEGDDYISFNGLSENNATLDGGTGDDTIENRKDIVSITGGDGNDSVYNSGDSVTVDTGAGLDTITNHGSNVSISGGADDDFILTASVYSLGTYAADVTINGGAGNDFISNERSSYVSIDAGDGDDTVDIYDGFFDSISTGAGNDSIKNVDGSNVSIDAGEGDDFIYNDYVYGVSINAGAGNDTIYNYSLGGGGNIIDGGEGDDLISLSSNEQHHWIEYTVGDGNDTILGYNSNTTINISGAAYASEYSGNDIVFTVGDGSIMLKDARDKPLPIIIGESGTSGGGSDSGGNGGGSSSGSGDGGRGGNDNSNNTSGGTSANEGRTSDASGGRSAVGSRGRSSSTSTDNGGNNIRVTTSSSRGGGSRIATGGSTVDLMSNWTTATQPTTTQPTATAQRVYSGGNQVVGDYVSGEKIVFGDVYTGSFYDGAGNFFVGSSTGALVIQNAADKVIDLQDAAGNSFIKAYSATTAGVIDGRGLTGFEIINGSAGSDAIFAGDGGSQLWGGLDVAADTMVGGGGTDIFIGGQTQGADVILNASATDIVHLNDANLSDIIATEENNGAIAVAFNTGNVVAVQSTELLSATFMLSDGSAYRYNHAAKTWQTA